MMGRGGGGGTLDLLMKAFRADLSEMASRPNTFSRVLRSTLLSMAGMGIVELCQPERRFKRALTREQGPPLAPEEIVVSGHSQPFLRLS
jgi:hypothetical protein